jgi:L-cystine uptake protein TcyP (sodium:dicarboxylate symporter family)
MWTNLLNRNGAGLFHGVQTVAVHVAIGAAGVVSLVFGLTFCATLILAPLGLPFVLVGMTLLSMVGQPSRY